MTAPLVQAAAGLRPGRLDLAGFEAFYLGVHPENRNAPDLRRRIRAAAETLAHQGLIRLPAGRGPGWNRLGPVELPLWVQIIKPPVPKCVRQPVSWMPELAWAAEERDPRRFEMLRQVNEFLVRCGGAPVPVPEKERSLEIFGDEKRIARNRTGGLFLGRIPLAMLGAVRVFAPIAHVRPQQAAPGQPLLLVENEDSFHSLHCWNAGRGRFAAIAYTAGNAIAKTAEGLDALAAEVGAGSLHYLGDIDPEGLRIPTRVNAMRRAVGIPPVEPAVPFVTWLLRHGRRCPAEGRPNAADLDAVAWLPPSLQAEARSLLLAGQRIPQESLGHMVLNQQFA